MSRKAAETEGLANASLNTSRVPPQKGVRGDEMPSTRNLLGNDQAKGLDAMAEKKKAGSKSTSAPQEGKGGSNARGAGKATQGDEGKGAQRRKQKK